MNDHQRSAAINRLREMAERLPEGSFDRTALSWAAEALEKQPPAPVPVPARYGGGAWRCAHCGCNLAAGGRHCTWCGRRVAWPHGESEAESNAVD